MTETRPISRTRQATALGCFLISGAAGLVYEVCWIRQASLVFGSTQEALSTVLSVFFLGLAIGGFAFGRLAVRSARPILFYSILEFALAGLALATLPLFRWADDAYGGFYRSLAHSPGALAFVRMALVSLVFLLPTVLMGGTLPLFVRQFVSRRSSILSSVGLLYGINTLGAAIGCAAAGMALIPTLGLRSSVELAAGANVLAGIVAAALRLEPPARGDRDVAPERGAPVELELSKPAKREPRARERGRSRPSPSRPVRRGARAEATPTVPSAIAGPALAGLVFLIGFAALAYEVVWTRFAGLIAFNTVYTYTVTLTVVLAGIVAGSWMAARLFDRAHGAATIVGTLQVLSGIAVTATLSAPPGFWRGLGHPLVTYGVLMFPAAALSGASFPLAVRLAVKDPELAAFGAGRISMLNTLGGIAGALGAGFLGLPRLGLQVTTTVLTATSLVTGFAFWTLLQRTGSLRTRGLAIGASLVAWFAIPLLSGTRLPADFLADRESLVDFREGKVSNLAVVHRDGIQSLLIDRLWQGQDRKTHQIVAAHLPMLLHPEPRRVLVVGVGSGQTASRFLDYEIERLDCVDIEPAVFDLLRAHFDTSWMNDPRVHVIVEDGRNHLIHSDARYDVISLEVGQLFRPGTASFYTLDFYRHVRERLAPGGLVSQFVPIAFLPPDAFRRVIASFIEVFPQSTLWYNTAELLLVGVRGDRFELHPSRLELLRTDARIRDDLSFRNWGGANRALRLPHVFLGSFLCGPGGLAAIAEGSPVFRDDPPTLDYKVSGVRLGAGYELPCVEILRPRVESVAILAPLAFPAESLRAIRLIQARNLDQVVSNRLLEPAWSARNVRDERLSVERALKWNPENSKAHGLMGDVLTAEGRLEEAVGFYQRSVDLRPEDGPAQLDLARTLSRLGRDAEAVAHYRAAIGEGIGGAEIYYSLGVSLEQSGDPRAAARALEEALRLAPRHEPARIRLAELRAAASARTR